MITITNHDYPLRDKAEGVDIPPWALISLRGDSTFDLSEAIRIESERRFIYGCI